MKTLNLVLAGILIILTSCQKAPTACIDNPSEEIKIFEVVEFTAGCSANAEQYEWAGTSDYFGNQIKSGETAKFSWSTPGLKDVTLTVENGKGEEQKISTSINVVDICYECMYKDSSDFYYEYGDIEMICGGTVYATSLNELDSYVISYESMGFECTKL